jgi:CheY-like chemotaxis protein
VIGNAFESASGAWRCTTGRVESRELTWTADRFSMPGSRGGVRKAMATKDRKLFVLVVDDDADVANAIAEQVRELGHQATVAFDATTAIQAVSSQPPDVVLTDVYMDGMDGYELIRAIRANGTPMLPIIAMSGGNKGYDTLGIAERLGADAVIKKPFRREELREILVQCLDGSPKPAGA